MAVVDLATPWREAASTPATDAAFRHRHDQLFELIRRQRAPAAERLATPAAPHPPVMRPDLVRLETRLARLADRGWRCPERVVVFLSAEPGPPFEVIPDPRDPLLVLFADRGADERLEAALVGAVACYHRWSGPTPIGRLAAQGTWDKWQAARNIPLAEWIYGAGLAVHAVADAFPDWPATAWLDVSAGELARLRQGEQRYRQRLESEIDQSGLGLVIRWLHGEAPPSLRRGPDGTVLPPAIGRYLGWRMLQHRVGRVGVLEAAGMGA